MNKGHDMLGGQGFIGTYQHHWWRYHWHYWYQPYQETWGGRDDILRLKPFWSGGCHNGDSDSIDPHVVEDPDVANDVYEQGLQQNDKVGNDKMKRRISRMQN